MNTDRDKKKTMVTADSRTQMLVKQNDELQVAEDETAAPILSFTHLSAKHISVLLIWQFIEDVLHAAPRRNTLFTHCHPSIPIA
mmetsp:Transcript_124715/g.216214  ORF Transcript_124715/g.216214 Transcript_124715/m.216214 type:complete len:84 (+) Transcript_124715:1409-1660(+)